MCIPQTVILIQWCCSSNVYHRLILIQCCHSSNMCTADCHINTTISFIQCVPQTVILTQCRSSSVCTTDCHINTEMPFIQYVPQTVILTPWCRSPSVCTTDCHINTVMASICIPQTVILTSWCRSWNSRFDDVPFASHSARLWDSNSGRVQTLAESKQWLENW